MPNSACGELNPNLDWAYACFRRNFCNYALLTGLRVNLLLLKISYYNAKHTTLQTA
jgi:hypothetical protein